MKTEMNPTATTTTTSSEKTFVDITEFMANSAATLRLYSEEANRLLARSAQLNADLLASEAARKGAEEGKRLAELELADANKKAEAAIANAAGDAKSPGRRIVERIGEDSAKRLADSLDSKNAEDMYKALYGTSDSLVKKLLEDKKVEGKVSEKYHWDKSSVHWAAVGGTVVLAAVTTGVGYYCYQAGRERGQLDMVDARVTFESHSKR